MGAYLKKMFLTLMAVVMLLQPMVSYGVDLSSAFDSLMNTGGSVSINAPGRFQSGARNTFSAGGFDMRVPRGSQTPSLFSFTPPSFSAGCNGISAHFGGFSFITGEQFEALIKNIGTGVIVGFVVQMAIKVTCPMCEDIINKLRQAAELAAKLAMDGCNAGAAIGQMLANSVVKDTVSLWNSNKGRCANEKVVYDGSASDVLASLTDVCRDPNKAFDEMVKMARKAAGATTDGSPQANAISQDQACKLGLGNLTWNALSGLEKDYSTPKVLIGGNQLDRKLLLLNLLGVKMVAGVSNAANSSTFSEVVMSCEQGDSSGKTVKSPSSKGPLEVECTPTILPTDKDAVQQVAGILMCGTEDTPTPKYGTRSINYILKFCDSQKLVVKDNTPVKELPKMYTCSDTAPGSATKNTAPFEFCYNVVLEDFKKVFPGMDKGFLVKVHDVLYWGMTKIANNKALIDGSTESNQLIALLNTAPFPLYQAMNAAAIYPLAASDILNGMGIVVAQQLAVSQLYDMLRINGRPGSPGGCIGALGLDQGSIFAIVDKTRAVMYEFKAEFARNYTLQQSMIEQIRMLNIAIQKQVLSTEVLNGAKQAEFINSGVANARARAPSGK